MHGLRRGVNFNALLSEVQEQLLSLNMKHAADALNELLERSQKEEWSSLKTIHALLAKERESRSDKARNKRMKDAGFPYMATLEEFDFGFQKSVSKKTYASAHGAQLA